MAKERFLVTGAGGCIGAWTVASLVAEGTEVVAFDLSGDLYRLRLAGVEDTSGVTFRQGDVRDEAAMKNLVESEAITHIVHLAALQVPFCFADPVLGSQVNVTGTINMLEAKRASSRVRGLSYASSIAVYGPAHLYEDGVATDADVAAPNTLYGTYTQANEWSARTYAADWDVGSVGLRPSIIYGPARDQGMSSDTTKAMLAAIFGAPFHIAFNGSSTYQHAADMAACFIAAARHETDEALVMNVDGPTATVDELVAMITAQIPEAAELISVGDVVLPVPGRIVGDAFVDLFGELNRPLDQGVADSIAAFRALADEGLVGVPES